MNRLHYKKTLPLTWAEVDLNAIRHNIRAIKRLAQKNKFYLPTRKNPVGKSYTRSDILAVIKSDAYGHGMRKVGSLLQSQGVKYFAVSDVQEGIILRESGIKRPILLFESTLPRFSRDIVQFDLMPTICNLNLAKSLNAYAKRKNKRVDVHIKVDTGMSRLGVWHKDAFKFIEKIHNLKNLSIKGIYTHFPVADTDKEFTQDQINILYELVISLDQKGLIIPFIHASNSMGIGGYRTHVLNIVRPGLMIYGLYPSNSLARKIKLKPALSVKSTLIFVKDITKGRSVSYGRSFIAKKDMRVATIPIGYNNGYLRANSNKASIIVNHVRCPVLGAVTMDQIMVDVTRARNVKLGMPVTIVGQDKKQKVTADELSTYANTINYEIVCGLGNRLERKFIKN